MGLGDAIQSSPRSVIGVWAGALAAPVTLVVAGGLWRSGRNSAWWFFGVGVVIYVGAGLLAGAFLHLSSPAAIPIMVLSPLVYPVAGLVWGGLIHQAASQGYVPLLGRAEVD
jgi:drug/metabolite transporter (DMT)-like permease